MLIFLWVLLPVAVLPVLCLIGQAAKKRPAKAGRFYPMFFNELPGGHCFCFFPDIPQSPIKCYTVLSYMPGEKREFGTPLFLDTLFPGSLERTPPCFAINRRMLRRSAHGPSSPSPRGNSMKLTEAAFRAGKTVINLKKEMTAVFPFGK